MAQLRAGEVQSYAIEKRYRRGDRTDVWVRVTSSIAKGSVEAYRVSLVEDIEQRKQAEIALAEYAQRLSLALDAVRMGDWAWDADSDIVTFSDRAAEIFGIPAGPRMTWTGMRELLHPDDTERVRLAVEEAVANRGRYDVEYRIRRPSDQREVWVAANGQAVHGGDGTVRGMTGVVQDITERKQVEERQSLLIRELHHRVKNTLATVQAIVGSTARTSSTIDEFYSAFVGRIVSLAHTHSLLTEDEWQTVALRKLLADELRPYDEGGRRVALSGPDVELTSDLAVPIGMAIHELTTNAAKHGALSRRGGRVEVRWDVAMGGDGIRRLDLHWLERDGPPVEPPTKQGFGSRLLRRVLTTQLGANIKIAFEPEGLRLRIVAPLPNRPSFLATLPA
jgi:PAS domain S-box-containing protein